MIQNRDIYLATGETQIIEWSWETECRNDGMTLSTSSWQESVPNGAVTFASPTVTGNVASVKLTGVFQGDTSIVLTSTFSDGQVLKRWAYVHVMDLET